jgi:small subunit ribosomal protein S6
VKKYEGLFILNTAGKEENVKELIDKVTEEITQSGGKVETVQKMDKRQFSRVADKKYTAGFYVNFIFESEPANVAALRTRFGMNEDVFRVMFSEAGAKKEEAASALAPA